VTAPYGYGDKGLSTHSLTMLHEACFQLDPHQVQFSLTSVKNYKLCDTAVLCPELGEAAQAAGL